MYLSRDIFSRGFERGSDGSEHPRDRELFFISKEIIKKRDKSRNGI